MRKLKKKKSFLLFVDPLLKRETSNIKKQALEGSNESFAYTVPVTGPFPRLLGSKSYLCPKRFLGCSALVSKVTPYFRPNPLASLPQPSLKGKGDGVFFKKAQKPQPFSSREGGGVASLPLLRYPLGNEVTPPFPKGKKGFAPPFPKGKRGWGRGTLVNLTQRREWCSFPIHIGEGQQSRGFYINEKTSFLANKKQTDRLFLISRPSTSLYLGVADSFDPKEGGTLLQGFCKKLEEKRLYKLESSNKQPIFTSLSNHSQEKNIALQTFWNYTFDKGRLKNYVSWFLQNFGELKTLSLIQELKAIGFEYATRAGISLGIDDLKVPFKKAQLLDESESYIKIGMNQYHRGEITGVERFQRLIETWHRTSEILKQEVINFFEKTDILNPVYMMAFSGARGNISQVRQLVGMRGLMADPQGQLIEFPIRSNFREGLTLTEYIISSYGARKGTVDTALRTANAGYLTRRLVDVAQHVIISNFDCGTKRGIYLNDMKEGKKIVYSLQNRLIGRVLAKNIYAPRRFTLPLQSNALPFPVGVASQRSTSISKAPSLPKGKQGSPTGPQNSTPLPRRGTDEGGRGGGGEEENKGASATLTSSTQRPSISTSAYINKKEQKNSQIENIILAKRNQQIDPSLASEISLVEKKVFVRSPLTCETKELVCQLCYGWSLAQGNLVSIGETVGVIAGQSIGEPGTQLTMRTFHTGGVFSGDITDQIRAPFNGFVYYLSLIPGSLIRNPNGQICFLTKGAGQLVFLKTRLQNLKKNLTGDFLSRREPLFQQSRGVLGEEGVLFNEKEEIRKIHIPAYTLLFKRNGEKVFQKEVIAQISDISTQQNIREEAQFTILSELEGQFYLGTVDFTEKFIGPKLEKQEKKDLKIGLLRKKYEFPKFINRRDQLIQAWTWGYAWILAGKICPLPFSSYMFPKVGDLISKKSTFVQIKWTIPAVHGNQFSSPTFLFSSLVAFRTKERALIQTQSNGLIFHFSKNVSLPDPSTSSLPFWVANKPHPSLKGKGVGGGLATQPQQKNSSIPRTPSLLSVTPTPFPFSSPTETGWGCFATQKSPFGAGDSMEVKEVGQKRHKKLIPNYLTKGFKNCYKEKIRFLNTKKTLQQNIFQIELNKISYKKFGYFLFFSLEDNLNGKKNLKYNFFSFKKTDYLLNEKKDIFFLPTSISSELLISSLNANKGNVLKKNESYFNKFLKHFLKEPKSIYTTKQALYLSGVRNFKPIKKEEPGEFKYLINYTIKDKNSNTSLKEKLAGNEKKEQRSRVGSPPQFGVANQTPLKETKYPLTSKRDTEDYQRGSVRSLPIIPLKGWQPLSGTSLGSTPTLSPYSHTAPPGLRRGTKGSRVWGGAPPSVEEGADKGQEKGQNTKLAYGTSQGERKELSKDGEGEPKNSSFAQNFSKTEANSVIKQVKKIFVLKKHKEKEIFNFYLPSQFLNHSNKSINRESKTNRFSIVKTESKKRIGEIFAKNYFPFLQSTNSSFSVPISTSSSYIIPVQKEEQSRRLKKLMSPYFVAKSNTLSVRNANVVSTWQKPILCCFPVPVGEGDTERESVTYEVPPAGLQRLEKKRKKCLLTWKDTKTNLKQLNSKKSAKHKIELLIKIQNIVNLSNNACMFFEKLEFPFFALPSFFNLQVDSNGPIDLSTHGQEEGEKKNKVDRQKGRAFLKTYLIKKNLKNPLLLYKVSKPFKESFMTETELKRSDPSPCSLRIKEIGKISFLRKKRNDKENVQKNIPYCLSAHFFISNRKESALPNVKISKVKGKLFSRNYQKYKYLNMLALRGTTQKAFMAKENSTTFQDIKMLVYVYLKKRTAKFDRNFNQLRFYQDNFIAKTHSFLKENFIKFYKSDVLKTLEILKEKKLNKLYYFSFRNISKHWKKIEKLSPHQRASHFRAPPPQKEGKVKVQKDFYSHRVSTQTHLGGHSFEKNVEERENSKYFINLQGLSFRQKNSEESQSKSTPSQQVNFEHFKGKLSLATEIGRKEAAATLRSVNAKKDTQPSKILKSNSPLRPEKYKTTEFLIKIIKSNIETYRNKNFRKNLKGLASLYKNLKKIKATNKKKTVKNKATSKKKKFISDLGKKNETEQKVVSTKKKGLKQEQKKKKSSSLSLGRIRTTKVSSFYARRPIKEKEIFFLKNEIISLINKNTSKKYNSSRKKGRSGRLPSLPIKKFFIKTLINKNKIISLNLRNISAFLFEKYTLPYTFFRKGSLSNRSLTLKRSSSGRKKKRPLRRRSKNRKLLKDRKDGLDKKILRSFPLKTSFATCVKNLSYQVVSKKCRFSPRSDSFIISLEYWKKMRKEREKDQIKNILFLKSHYKSMKNYFDFKLSPLFSTKVDSEQEKVKTVSFADPLLAKHIDSSSIEAESQTMDKATNELKYFGHSYKPNFSLDETYRIFKIGDSTRFVPLAHKFEKKKTGFTIRTKFSNNQSFLAKVSRSLPVDSKELSTSKQATKVTFFSYIEKPILLCPYKISINFDILQHKKRTIYNDLSYKKQQAPLRFFDFQWPNEAKNGAGDDLYSPSSFPYGDGKRPKGFRERSGPLVFSTQYPLSSKMKFEGSVDQRKVSIRTKFLWKLYRKFYNFNVNNLHNFRIFSFLSSNSYIKDFSFSFYRTPTDGVAKLGQAQERNKEQIRPKYSSYFLLLSEGWFYKNIRSSNFLVNKQPHIGPCSIFENASMRSQNFHNKQNRVKISKDDLLFDSTNILLSRVKFSSPFFLFYRKASSSHVRGSDSGASEVSKSDFRFKSNESLLVPLRVQGVAKKEEKIKEFKKKLITKSISLLPNKNKYFWINNKKVRFKPLSLFNVLNTTKGAKIHSPVHHSEERDSVAVSLSSPGVVATVLPKESVHGSAKGKLGKKRKKENNLFLIRKLHQYKPVEDNILSYKTKILKKHNKSNFYSVLAKNYGKILNCSSFFAPRSSLKPIPSSVEVEVDFWSRAIARSQLQTKTVSPTLSATYLKAINNIIRFNWNGFPNDTFVVPSFGSFPVFLSQKKGSMVEFSNPSFVLKKAYTNNFNLNRQTMNLNTLSRKSFIGVDWNFYHYSTFSFWTNILKQTQTNKMYVNKDIFVEPFKAFLSIPNTLYANTNFFYFFNSSKNFYPSKSFITNKINIKDFLTTYIKKLENIEKNIIGLTGKKKFKKNNFDTITSTLYQSNLQTTPYKGSLGQLQKSFQYSYPLPPFPLSLPQPLFPLGKGKDDFNKMKNSLEIFKILFKQIFEQSTFGYNLIKNFETYNDNMKSLLLSKAKKLKKNKFLSGPVNGIKNINNHIFSKTSFFSPFDGEIIVISSLNLFKRNLLFSELAEKFELKNLYENYLKSNYKKIKFKVKIYKKSTKIKKKEKEKLLKKMLKTESLKTSCLILTKKDCVSFSSLSYYNLTSKVRKNSSGYFSNIVNKVKSGPSNNDTEKMNENKNKIKITTSLKIKPFFTSSLRSSPSILTMQRKPFPRSKQPPTSVPTAFRKKKEIFCPFPYGDREGNNLENLKESNVVLLNIGDFVLTGQYLFSNNNKFFETPKQKDSNSFVKKAFNQSGQLIHFGFETSLTKMDGILKIDGINGFQKLSSPQPFSSREEGGVAPKELPLLSYPILPIREKGIGFSLKGSTNLLKVKKTKQIGERKKREGKHPVERNGNRIGHNPIWDNKVEGEKILCNLKNLNKHDSNNKIIEKIPIEHKIENGVIKDFNLLSFFHPKQFTGQNWIFTVRKAQSIYISKRTIFHSSHGDFIKKRVPIITLAYETLKTGDIVQGIPKVEQFFEARTTKKGRLFLENLPNLVAGLYLYYTKRLKKLSPSAFLGPSRASNPIGSKGKASVIPLTGRVGRSPMGGGLSFSKEQKNNLSPQKISKAQNKKGNSLNRDSAQALPPFPKPHPLFPKGKGGASGKQAASVAESSKEKNNSIKSASTSARKQTSSTQGSLSKGLKNGQKTLYYESSIAQSKGFVSGTKDSLKNQAKTKLTKSEKELIPSSSTLPIKREKNHIKTKEEGMAGLPTNRELVRQTFYKIQQIIIDGVQRVYQGQGVTIAEKHLEIIVKQMTCRVKIINGGDTGFFPGEIVHIDFVEYVNNLLIQRKAYYKPQVLGITRSSLQVDSFISAASFQQTTKILSASALSKKKDFLKGLKENVILGNLIPSGTGYFNKFLSV